MQRDPLHAGEGAVETRRASIVPREIADVVDASVARGVRHSLLVADEDDLHGWAKRTPALDRVSLDVADVTPERLRDCEQSEHCGRQ